MPDDLVPPHEPGRAPTGRDSLGAVGPHRSATVIFAQGFSPRASADAHSSWRRVDWQMRATGFTGSMVTAGYRPGDTNDIVNRHH